MDLRPRQFLLSVEDIEDRAVAGDAVLGAPGAEAGGRNA
jgi:hypothetical protein